jgi:hypothetical protein
LSKSLFVSIYMWLSLTRARHFIRSVTERDVSLKQMDIIECNQEVAEKPEQRDIVCSHTKSNNSLEVNLVNAQALREYLALIWNTYQACSKTQKGTTLDELVRNLNIHRKAAIRLMNKAHAPRSLQGFKGGRQKQYSEESKLHLERLWKHMAYMCPIRLKAALPQWIDFYEHKNFNASLRSELLAMSASTIHRFLADARSALRRKENCGTRRGPNKHITAVPIRPLGETPQVPGHCEIDCVAHCGGSLSGIFAWTLTLTDIVTGWTECEALWGKTGAAVRVALNTIEKRLPFPLKALYSDNGCEFMNEDVLEFYLKGDHLGQLSPILFFRGRPYKSNDQCYVEQKNYTHVRNLFGYGRIDWEPASKMMNTIYRKEWRQLQNFYMPQQRLIEKVRIKSKVKRKMSPPITPYIRLRPWLDSENLVRLDEEYSKINPILWRTKQRKKTSSMFGYLKDDIDKSEWGRMAK